MQPFLKKKLIGTGIYLAVLILTGAGIGSAAFAQFIQTNSSMIVDGMVVGVGTSSFTLDTAGSSAFEIGIDARTIFPSGLALSGLTPGDVVSVVARRNGSGTPVARIIRMNSGSGYGFPGETVIIHRGTIVSKGASSFTINSGVALITFEVVSSSRFIRTNFSLLAPGDTVQVIGQDSGSSFVARTVVKR